MESLMGERAAQLVLRALSQRVHMLRLLTGASEIVDERAANRMRLLVA